MNAILVQPLSTLQTVSVFRKPGYVDACVANSAKIVQNGVEYRSFTLAQFAKINKEFALNEKSQPSPPSLTDQAINVVGTMKRMTVAAVTGNQILCSDKQMRERLKICLDCENLILPALRCSKCGCFMSGVPGKTRLATEKCPLTPPKWTLIVN